MFGIRVMTEKSYVERIRMAEFSGAGRGVAHAELEAYKNNVAKHREANIIVTNVKLISGPDYCSEGWFGGSSIEYRPSVYSVDFRLINGGMETDITLKFDDPDVSISKIKRAIQAKICGGGCGNDED